MRHILMILLILTFNKIYGQNIHQSESYLQNKYKYSASISSGTIQYIDKSIEVLNDSLFDKYLSDYDFYIGNFRGLICWTPDDFKAILIRSNKTDKYFLLEPLDRNGPDSVTINIFENKLIKSIDIINYCNLISDLLVKIGNANPRISDPISINTDTIQIKYFNDYTNDKLWRLINFNFDKNGLLREISLINPKTGYNYKDSMKEIEYMNNKK